MSQFHPRAGQIYLPIQNMSPLQVAAETVAIPAGAAGTMVNFYIEKKPILDSHNCFVGGFGDTSLALTSTAFTTEVSPTTEDTDMANGEYWIDYITGKGRGKKADNSVSMTADYYVFTALASGGGGSGAPTNAQYVTLATNGSLSAERILTGTANQITITDNGANSTVVLSLPQNIHTAATPTFAKMLIGSTASFTDFSGAQMVASQANTGETHVYNVGLVGEGVASAVDTNIWGVGLYGVGLTNSGTRSGGVIGDGKVTASADTGSAIGIRGYATDTHAGGLNIGVYSEASGGASNYALYMQAGDILSIAAQAWTLIDNNASALSFDASGATGILKIITTNASEGVTMSGTLGVTGTTTLSTVSQSNLTTWSAGAAITAGSYQIGRDADATNQLHFNVPTGASFEFSVNDVARWVVSSSGFTMTPLAQTSGTGYGLLYTAAAHTGLTASTENTDINFNLARTVQFGTGAMTLQRFARIQGPTVAAVGASNFSTVGTLEIESPTVGSNVTFTGINGALRFGSSMTAPSNAGFSYAAGRVPAHTITLTGTTQVTAIPAATGLNIGALTITDASAVTVDTAAGLFVAPPVAAGSVTITNTWGIYTTGSILSTGNGNIFGDGTTTPVSNLVATFTRSGATTFAIGLRNGNSGFTTNDGFDIQLLSNSQVNLNNRESTAIAVWTASVQRWVWDGAGKITFTPGAAGSGATSDFVFTASAPTAQTLSTEVPTLKLDMSATMQHATGALTTQRDFYVLARTHSFVGSSTLTTASTLNISGAPIAGTNATITNAFAAQISGATTQVSAAGLIVRAIDVPAHTVTVTGTTQVTSVGIAGIGIGQITITDASALTVDSSASLYIANAPVAAGSVTLTKTYSLWIDAGLPRIDSTSANGSVATVLGSVGPAGSNTTVQEWLTVDINGTTRYIPCF